MSKRFRDIGIWEKPWYRLMTPLQKCAWSYVTDRCDSVGVWDADKEMADIFIGEKVDWEALLSATNGNIEALENGKWFLVDFCDFQYGELKVECKPHASYLRLLEKHGLEGYSKGIHTLKEKDKEKDKEKEKDRIAFVFDTGMFQNISDKQVEMWGQAYPALEIETELAKASSWLKANPNKQKKNYQRFLVNWFSRAQERGGDKKNAKRY